MYTQTETEAVKKNINLIAKGDILKKLAIPPHTPYNTFSDDLVNFCDLGTPPLF